jgi:hypothetical protein
VINQNISAIVKGLFLVLTTVTLIAFFWDTLEKIANKWWKRSFVGYNTLYYLDPENKVLKEVIVSRRHFLSAELPKRVLAISVPLGGFLNTACVLSEHKEVLNLWKVRKRTDSASARIQYVRLIDQFNDSVSLPVDEALLFLELKQGSKEFFPNWEHVFLQMQDLVVYLDTQLVTHARDCQEEYVNTLKAEIEKFQQERTELKEAQRKMFVTIHKSIRMLSEARPSITSSHIVALIELLINELVSRLPREEATQDTPQDHETSAA